MTIEVKDVVSSAISRIGYNHLQSALYVEFLQTGKTYAYNGVSNELFVGAINSSSIGNYVQQSIIANYPGVPSFMPKPDDCDFSHKWVSNNYTGMAAGW
jgi:hypothetical protein